MTTKSTAASSGRTLVYFHACAPHTDITSLSAPLGRRPRNAVRAGDYLHDKMRTILG
ncbi:hypothetical protein [Streptomyces sp. NPDC053720]|uniref:hypothetical protein n=1 Tax=Streptomyces sp. NPDC053720 TaxID=3154855 RepID=UPI00343160B2